MIKTPEDMAVLLLERAEDKWPDDFEPIEPDQTNIIFLSGLMTELEEQGLATSPYTLAGRGKELYDQMKRFGFGIEKRTAMETRVNIEMAIQMKEETRKED